MQRFSLILLCLVLFAACWDDDVFSPANSCPDLPAARFCSFLSDLSRADYRTAITGRFELLAAQGGSFGARDTCFMDNPGARVIELREDNTFATTIDGVRTEGTWGIEMSEPEPGVFRFRAVATSGIFVLPLPDLQCAEDIYTVNRIPVDGQFSTYRKE